MKRLSFLFILLAVFLLATSTACDAGKPSGNKVDKSGYIIVHYNNQLLMEAYCVEQGGVFNGIYDWKPVPGTRKTLYTLDYAVSNMPSTGQRCDCLVTKSVPPDECLMLTWKDPTTRYDLTSHEADGVFVPVERLE